MTGRIRTFFRSSWTGRFIRREVAEAHPRQSTKETYEVPETGAEEYLESRMADPEYREAYEATREADNADQ